MKKVIRPIIASCALIFTLTACQKNTKDITSNEISESVMMKINKLGFSTQNVIKTEAGFLVEGDILLTEKELNQQPSSPNMIVAKEEQYRTFNLVSVTNHATINIALNNSSPQHEAAFSASLDEAISRYNAENLQIRFARVAPGAADITIVAYYEVSNVLGSAGFPNSTGDPYNQVKMNTYWYGTGIDPTNVNYIGTIMSHEVGHCIGFRHTDYMNRAYSCGGRKSNEGQANSGIGAVYIPGTATGGDPNSWMLACVSSNANRPFNTNDKIALSYVY